MASKRARSEEQNQLDDSMQSLISEFNAITNYTVNDLAKFMRKYLAKSEECRRSIYDVQHEVNEVQIKVKAIEEKLKSKDNDDKANKTKMDLVASNMREMKDSSLEVEAKTHRVEQKLIDRHVFISGFPVKPNKEEVLEKLRTLYEISQESVDTSYCYQFSLRPKASSTPGASRAEPKTIFHMVVEFKDNQGKELFMKNKKEKGPLAFEQLTSQKLKDDDRKSLIRCVNRLSKFNLKVQRELQSAKADQKVFSYQLHNGLFRVKEREDSGWNIIGTDNALKPFTAQKKPSNQ